MCLISTTVPVIHFGQKKWIWCLSVGNNLMAQIGSLMKGQRRHLAMCLLELYIYLLMLRKTSLCLSLHSLSEYLYCVLDGARDVTQSHEKQLENHII